jgi:hypothetical protein
MKRQIRRLIVVVASAGTLSACYETQYADTVVHPDGSVDRAIVQNVALTPEPARRADVWRESRVVKTGPQDPWDGTIGGLPAPAKKDEEAMFAARGHFRSVADVPDHYADMAKDAVEASRLRRTYTEQDLGLVTERVWTETLNDIVNPTQMATARDQLAQINVKLLKAGLDEALGRSYDYEEYVRWVGDIERTFFGMMVDQALEARAAGRRLSSSDTPPGANALIEARYGIPVPEGEDGEKKLRAFLERKTREMVKKRLPAGASRATGAGDLTPGQVTTIVSAIWALSDHGLITFEATGDGAKFAAGAARITAAELGGREALEKKAEILGERSLGMAFVNSDRKFAFSLALPGTIVDTNGTLDSDSKVRWAFELGDAFAFGYTMHCRSLQANADGQRALGVAAPIDSRAAMVQYASLVNGQKELLAAVQLAIREKTRTPLLAYRASLDDGKNQQQLARVDRLFALLGMGR